MLDRAFIRRVRLLHGRQEVITFRYTVDRGKRLVEHVTVEVPNSFLDSPPRAAAREPKK